MKIMNTVNTNMNSTTSDESNHQPLGSIGLAGSTSIGALPLPTTIGALGIIFTARFENLVHLHKVLAFVYQTTVQPSVVHVFPFQFIQEACETDPVRSCKWDYLQANSSGDF